MKDDILRQNREGRSSKLLHFKGCKALSMTLERKRMIIMVFRKCWLLVMEVRRKEVSPLLRRNLSYLDNFLCDRIRDDFQKCWGVFSTLEMEGLHHQVGQ